VGGYTNYSLQGTTTAAWANLSNNYPLTTLARHFKYVSVQLGRNDITAGTPLSKYVAYMGRIVELLDRADTRVTLMCPSPAATSPDGVSFTPIKNPDLADDYVCWFEGCNGLHGTDFTGRGCRQCSSDSQVFFVDDDLEVSKGDDPLFESNGFNLVPVTFPADALDQAVAAAPTPVASAFAAVSPATSAWYCHTVLFDNGLLTGQYQWIQDWVNGVNSVWSPFSQAPEPGWLFEVRPWLLSADGVHPNTYGHVCIADNQATMSNVIGDRTVDLPNYIR
jgi:hypothetical protein